MLDREFRAAEDGRVGVGRVQLHDVRDQDVAGRAEGQADLDVEVVVGEVESAFGDVVGLVRGALYGAGEGGGGWGEGCLPLVGPHVEEPGDLGGWFLVLFAMRFALDDAIGEGRTACWLAW